MLVKGSPVELVGVGEALRPGALPDGDQPVLVWVQHPPLLAHWLWVGDSCREEAIILNPSIETSPLVVTVTDGKRRLDEGLRKGSSSPGVGQAPGDQGVLLLVCRVALRLLALHTGADTPEADKVNLDEQEGIWHS